MESNDSDEASSKERSKGRSGSRQEGQSNDNQKTSRSTVSNRSCVSRASDGILTASWLVF